MFGDIGWAELMLIGIVALIVIGPEDLPQMFRQLGRFTAKLRSMSRDFSRAMEQAAKESGVKDVADGLRGATSVTSTGLNKVKAAADRFEKWDPIKQATASPAATATAAVPPAASIAATPVTASTIHGPATQALIDKQAAKKAILAQTAEKLKAVDAGISPPAPSTTKKPLAVNPSVKVVETPPPVAKPRTARKPKKAEQA
jgi:sec-independent protein translocase protein TatB